MKKILIVCVLFLSTLHLKAANELWLGQKYSVGISFQIIAAQELAGQRLRHLPMVAYPIEYLEAGLSGSVTVRFNVFTDGTVADIESVSGEKHELFSATKKAIEALRFAQLPNEGSARHISKTMQCTVTFVAAEQNPSSSQP
jgi:TonB family protein